MPSNAVQAVEVSQSTLLRSAANAMLNNRVSDPFCANISGKRVNMRVFSSSGVPHVILSHAGSHAETIYEVSRASALREVALARPGDPVGRAYGDALKRWESAGLLRKVVPGC